MGASAAAAADSTRVIVAFKPGATAAIRSAVSAARSSVQIAIFGMDAMAVEVPTQALNGLASNPNLEHVEEDVKRYLLSGTTPSTGTHHASGQLVPYGIKMVQADQLSDSLAGNSKVCIIDSGYSLGHEDLDTSTNVSGKYDSGTGWGYTDENHHGTHLAGTIAALNNADTWVVGVNPNQQLKLLGAWQRLRGQGDNGVMLTLYQQSDVPDAALKTLTSLSETHWQRLQQALEAAPTASRSAPP